MSKFDFLETEYSMKKMETPFLGYAGKVQGFYFIVLINHDDSKFCTIKIGVYRDADVESLLSLLKQEKPLKRVNFSVEKASLTIRYRLSLFQSRERKRFQQILEILLPFLKEHGYHSGSFFSGKDDNQLKLAQIGRKYLYLTEKEYSQESFDLEAKKEEYHRQEGNILLGILGLLILAPLGIVIYVLLGKIGNFYYFCFSGVIAVLACYIYKFLTGKLSKYSLFFIFLILVSMLFLSNFLEFIWRFYDELQTEYYDVTFLDALQGGYFMFLEDREIRYNVIVGFLVDFVISIGISIYTLYREFQKELQSLESKKL